MVRVQLRAPIVSSQVLSLSLTQMTQREMAELFDVSTDNVGLHLKNIYENGELTREATTEESSVVQTEGNRQVQRPVTLYNLDAILAVGYRVRSPRGVQFRRAKKHDRRSDCNKESTGRPLTTDSLPKRRIE